MKIDYDTVLEEYLNISDIKSKLDDSIENDDDIFGPSESDYQKTEKAKALVQHQHLIILEEI